MRIPDINPHMVWKPISLATPEELVPEKTLVRYISINDLSQRLGLFQSLRQVYEVYAYWQSHKLREVPILDDLGWMETHRVEYLSEPDPIDLDEDDDTCL